MIPLRDDNPSTIAPIVTIALIVACVLVFLWQLSFGAEGGQRIVYALGAIPAVLLGKEQLPPELMLIPPWASVFTSMFMHGGWMHLIGNMLYLWIFGNNVEDVMGHVRFVIFYLLCGILAALSHAVTDPTSTIPMVGASGAISGVLGAYILLFPRAHVLVFMPGIGMMRVAAGVVLGLWFFMQLLSGGMSIGGAGGGVAFFAHIGGFVAGMVLIGFFTRPEVPFFSPARHGRWDV
jgi:membrane associated rhomboid family serine protease